MCPLNVTSYINVHRWGTKIPVNTVRYGPGLYTTILFQCQASVPGIGSMYLETLLCRLEREIQHGNGKHQSFSQHPKGETTFFFRFVDDTTFWIWTNPPVEYVVIFSKNLKEFIQFSHICMFTRKYIVYRFVCMYLYTGMYVL